MREELTGISNQVISTNLQQNIIFHNFKNTREDIDKPFITNKVIFFLRHGMTDINKNTDTPKHDNTPLSKEEFDYKHQDESEYTPGTIAYQALQIKKALGSNIHQIRIHVPFSITRDVQTAQILADILGLPFPTTLEEPLPSWLVNEENLRTSYKDLQQINKIQSNGTRYLISDDFQESKLTVSTRHSESFKKILTNKDNYVKYEIMIGHRTGISFLDSLKHNKKILNFEPKEFGPGTLLSASLDKDGQFLNQSHFNVFEFDINRYDEQIEELSQIKNIGISKTQSLIDNQNMVNLYLEKLKNELFINETDDKNHQIEKIKKIHECLYSDHPFIAKYTTFFLQEFLSQEHLKSGIKAKYELLLIDFLCNVFRKKGFFSLSDKKEFFNIFYLKNKKSEFWKQILYILALDNQLDSVLGDLITIPEIKDCIYHITTYVHHVEEVIQLYLSKNKDKKQKDNFKKFINNILDKEILHGDVLLPRIKNLFIAQSMLKIGNISGKLGDVKKINMLFGYSGAKFLVKLYPKIFSQRFLLRNVHIQKLLNDIHIPKKDDSTYLKQLFNLLSYENKIPLCNFIDLFRIGVDKISHYPTFIKIENIKRINAMLGINFIVGKKNREYFHGDKKIISLENIKKRRITKKDLFRLAEIARGPMTNQIKTYFAEHFATKNYLDLQKNKRHIYKTLGPRVINMFLPQLTGHVILSTSPGSNTLNTNMINDLSIVLWGPYAKQLKDILKEMGITSYEILLEKYDSGELSKDLLGPYGKKLIGLVLGEEISGKVSLEHIQRLKNLIFSE